MIRILTVIGARPQFIKASALSGEFLKKHADSVQEDLLHTGQHYDENMSQVFFDQMGIPKPKFKLNLKGDSEEQFQQMLEGIEQVLLNHSYDLIIVYGDTNSTLAGALVAKQMDIPLVHIEAGLRSFNLEMPEERNRIQTDKISSLLFCPTPTSIENLLNEGFNIHNKGLSSENPELVMSGDIMYDCVLNFEKFATPIAEIRDKYEIDTDYILCTVHRDFNTDDPKVLREILSAIARIGKDENIQIVLPLHPRTKKQMETSNFRGRNNHAIHDFIQFIPPVSYLEMIQLEAHAQWIITDSGGVQKEAYFFKKKCLVLRPQTEWVEILEEKAAKLGHGSEEKILKAYQELKNYPNPNFRPIFGNGTTAATIAEKIKESFHD